MKLQNKKENVFHIKFQSTWITVCPLRYCSQKNKIFWTEWKDFSSSWNISAQMSSALIGQLSRPEIAAEFFCLNLTYGMLGPEGVCEGECVAWPWWRDTNMSKIDNQPANTLSKSNQQNFQKLTIIYKKLKLIIKKI